MDGDATGPSEGTLVRLLASIGISADMRQREAIRDVLTTSGGLPTETLAAVIASVLARSPRQQERLLEFLPRWLEPAEEPKRDEPEEDEPGPMSRPAPAGEPQSIVQSTMQIGRLFVAEVKSTNAWITAVAAGSLAILVAGAAWFGLQSEVDSGLQALQVRLTSLEIGMEAVLFVGIALPAIFPIGFMVMKLMDAVAAWLKARRERPQPEIVELPPGSTYFAFEAVGSRPTSVFDRRQMQAIARAVPSRATNIEGRRPDAGRSIAATAARGLPTLRFGALRENWPVIVLVDRTSAARAWSEFPEQLVAGLGTAGIDAALGHFSGRLNRFDLEGVGRVDLTGLFSQYTLLLLVSDGSGLRARESGDVAALRQLADSGRALWIDEREERFWRPFDPQFASRMPTCQATAAGVEGALKALGPPKAAAIEFHPLLADLPAVVADAHASTVLGDALGWAAACAMLQPIGVGLAQDLRARFFRHLQPIAFGRIAMLQGASLTSDGLSFDTPLLVHLRREFGRCLSFERQDEILAVLREAVERRPPHVTDGSMAYLTWRWHRARFLLDADPDEAVKALGSEIKGTMLASEMRRELARRRLPGETGDGDAKRILPLLQLANDMPSFVAQLAGLGASIASPDVGPWSYDISDRRQIDFPSVPVELVAVPGRPEILALYPDGRIDIGTLDGGAPRIAGAIGELPSGTRRLHEAGGMIAVSPEGRFVALAFAEARETLLLLELGASTKLLLGVTMTNLPIEALAFDPLGATLAVGCRGKGLSLVDIAARQAARNEPPIDPPKFSLPERHFTALAFSTGGDTLLAATEDGQVIMVDPKRPDDEKARSVAVDLPTIEAVASGPEGFQLVAAGGGEWLAIDLKGVTHGPWPVPPRLLADLPSPPPRPLLGVVDDEPVMALLLGERLAILHLRNGADLLTEEPGRGHVALGVAQGFALLRGATPQQVTAHSFVRPGSEAEAK